MEKTSKKLHLQEMLANKSLKDLLTIMYENHISAPEGFSSEDWELLLLMIRVEEDIRLEYYRELLDPDIELLKDPDREVPPEILEYEELQRHKGEVLLMADKMQYQLCRITERFLLLPENTNKLFGRMNDMTMEYFRKAAAGELETDDEGVFIKETPPELVHRIRGPEYLGYAEVKSILPGEDPWERSRVYGMAIPEEVLSTLREIDGPDFEKQRKNYNIISDCCDILIQYHEFSSLKNAYSLYQSVSGEEKLPEILSWEAFPKAVTQVLADNEYVAIAKRGERFFIYEPYAAEEMLDEGLSLLDALAEEWDDELTYYIPSPEEMYEYLNHGYWSTRKPYQELMQYLIEYYHDEMVMEQMSLGMFRAISNDDTYGQKDAYMMDDVYEDAQEALAEIVFYLKADQGVEMVWEEMKSLWYTVTDEAKDRFRQILIDCDEVTNKPFYRGFTHAAAE
ncbi:MAG: hypothetical protein IJ109_04010 [Firmicutes bacterium]|nr:hypothetical protein [Bacillota bacterium]